MTQNNSKPLTVQFIIHCVWNNETLLWTFDNNKTFEELKEDLQKDYKLKKETYYFKINNQIINDNEILKEKGVENGSCVDIVSNNCIKIDIDTESWKDNNEKMQRYFLLSEFNGIKADENGEVKVCFKKYFGCFV